MKLVILVKLQQVLRRRTNCVCVCLQCKVLELATDAEAKVELLCTGAIVIGRIWRVRPTFGYESLAYPSIKMLTINLFAQNM